MGNEPDSWINTPAFKWTPEVPLRLEPQFSADTGISSATAAEAEIAEPRFEPAPPAAPDVPAAKPRFTPAVAQTEAAQPGLFLPRLGVGLAQGVALLALFTARVNLDPYFFSAAIMVLLFAPLLVLAGLGRMRLVPLLLWTGFAAALLAASGSYHHWRTLSSDGGHPGLALLALTTLFLFAGQSLVQAGAQAGGKDYPAHYRSAWRLAIRIVLCALFAGLAWAAAGAASGFLREHYPQAVFAPLMLPLVTLSAALAAQLTGEKFLAALQEGVIFVFTLALPMLLLLGIAVAGLGALGRWQPSLGVCAVLGLLLIIAINASYRDGTSWRPYWRRRLEFAASLVLLPLILLAGLALATRIAEYGWTDGRIFAAAGLLLMAGYGICYAGSALISLGGGGWMQRIEGSNQAMAFAGLALIVALASPIADPARLAVAAQAYRLEQHKVAADAFDFIWLRDAGLRFGHEALVKMAAGKSAPAVARGAFEALAAKPSAERPTPTEIGANIHVHSAVNSNEGLPAGLLARDWSGVPGAPPCLTSASLSCDAFFSDLDGDGRSEVLLAYGTGARWWAAVMKQGQDSQGKMDGGWYVAGTLAAPPCPGGLEALRAGHFEAVRPTGSWRDLVVDGIRLSVQPPSPGPASLASACPPL